MRRPQAHNVKYHAPPIFPQPGSVTDERSRRVTTPAVLVTFSDWSLVSEFCQLLRALPVIDVIDI